MSDFARWPLLSEAFSRLGRPVVVVDLETTGGNFYQDRITEVALVRFEQGRATHYEQLVNPCRSIPEFVARLTGLHDETVKNAPVFADIAADLLPLLQGAVVVAHNNRFDYTFLRHEFARIHTDFAAPSLCTVQLSRRLYPEFYKHSLDSIIERTGIQTANRHRAMTDVAALCDYLELSLAEKNHQQWDEHVRVLMNPKMLPTWLPDSLAQQLYALPDSYGVLVWFDHFGKAQAIEAHERAYSETATLLHSKKLPPHIKAAASIRFIPAVGQLHTLWLKAQTMQEYQLMPSEKSTSFSTIRFIADEHGSLQARIVLLNSGTRNWRPYGLFAHKKAAKRALTQWSQEHRLCPDSLNILPTSYAKGEPCPVEAVGKCNGNCRQPHGIKHQNQRITELAALLPVTDWGKAHEIEITETDPLTGNSITLLCAGGALALPDGSWYFDSSLPLVIKNKFRQDKENIRLIA